MTQHIPLDHGDPVSEAFFDAIQELLGAAAPALSITVTSATVLTLAASAENGQASVAIQGRYRWRTSNTTATLPGGLSDGWHPVFVTGSDNDFSGSTEDPDSPTDYSFGLQILASGNTPATEIYRQIGVVEVTSGAITSYRQTVGGGRIDGQPVDATADHASQVPLRGRAASGQTANLLELINESGQKILQASEARVRATGFLDGKVIGGRVRRTAGNMSIPNNQSGFTAINFNTLDWESSGGVWSVGIPNTLFVTEPGLHTITGYFVFAGPNDVGQRVGLIVKNGESLTPLAEQSAPGRTSPGSGMGGNALSLTATGVPLEGGDYVQLLAWQNSGAALDVLADAFHHAVFAMTRDGALPS